MSELPPEVTVLDREEVARILKTSPSTVTRMTQRGELHGFRTGENGGLARWTLADVMSYIEKQRATGRAVVRQLPRNHHRQRLRIQAVDAEPWDVA